VVDVEPVVQTKVESTPSSPKWATSSSRERFVREKEGDKEKVGEKTTAAQQQQQRCEWEKCVHDLLEENFRSLSLGKKA
jgi:hypothetical protein